MGTEKDEMDNAPGITAEERTMMTMRVWTVWEFRSVDGKQVVRVTHPAHPDDYRFVHEYQRILYRGPNPTERA